MRSPPGEPFGALHQPVVIVVDHEQRRALIGLRVVDGRNQVLGILGVQLRPRQGFPVIQQRRLVKQEILHLAAGHVSHCWYSSPG